MMIGPVMGGMTPFSMAMHPQSGLPGISPGGPVMAMPSMFGVPNMYSMPTVSCETSSLKLNILYSDIFRSVMEITCAVIPILVLLFFFVLFIKWSWSLDMVRCDHVRMHWAWTSMDLGARTHHDHMIQISCSICAERESSTWVQRSNDLVDCLEVDES